jgi:hypothetical protein
MNEKSKRDYSVFFYLFNSPQISVGLKVRNLLIGFCKEAIQEVLTEEEIEKLFELHSNPAFLEIAKKFPLLKQAFNDAFVELRSSRTPKLGKLLNIKNYDKR